MSAAWVGVGRFVAGAVGTGTFKGAVQGSLTLLAFFGVGAGLGAMEIAADSWQAAAAHGVTGGVIAELQGGKFAHGFLSAAANKAVHSRLPTDMHPALGGMVSAIVGGTVSEVSGGKFANGAITAAMAYAFNQVLSRWPTAAQAQGQQALADARRVQQQAQAEAALTVIEVAEPGIGFLPGGDMMLCLVQGCSSVDWGLAAMGLWPGGGKAGNLMIKNIGKGHRRAPEFRGGRVSEAGFLDAAETWLGSGYRSLPDGRYISADGMRQVRYGRHEVSSNRHHGHFESYDRPGGRIIENTMVEITP